MSDDAIRTHVLVEQDGVEHWLPFQEYFVRYRCEPRTIRVDYRGREHAVVSARLAADFDDGPVGAVVLCPSNPYLSIDPILAVPGLHELLRSCGAPVVAVSPVVGGRALKGPTAKIMRELGLQVDGEAIARHYRGVIDGLVLDTRDRDDAQRVEALGIRALVTSSVMKTLQDRIRLAREVLEFAATLDGRKAS
jgi:LPPG:FO 2-phospho-L-lactate transferase